jgi:pre-mRNA branch site protein p14
MYDIFGKYGGIRQIRVGNAPETRGTAFVVYEDVYDAKAACEHLSGFNVGGRYLVVLYYHATRTGKMDRGLVEAEVAALRARVAAGDAAAGDESGVSLDDEGDKKMLRR